MAVADADPSGQKAIDALLEAEGHANGCARLLGDLLLTELSEKQAELREEALFAVRRCERQVLLARGFLTHPDGALNNVACGECVDRRRARLSD